MSPFQPAESVQLKSDEFIQNTPSKAKLITGLILPPITPLPRAVEKIFNVSKFLWHCVASFLEWTLVWKFGHTSFLHRAVTAENMVISKTSIDVCCRFKRGRTRLFSLGCTASEHCEFYVCLFHSKTVLRFEGLFYIADDSVNLYQNIRISISSGVSPIRPPQYSLWVSQWILRRGLNLIDFSTLTSAGDIRLKPKELRPVLRT